MKTKAAKAPNAAKACAEARSLCLGNPNRGTRPERMIRKRRLAEMLGIHHSTLDRWMYEGNFPRGIRLSDQITVFRMSDVEEWLRRREVPSI